MSYINEALKKAQKERDGRYERFGGIIASGAAHSPGRRPWIWAALLAGSAVAVLLFLYGRQATAPKAPALPKAERLVAEAPRQGGQPAPAAPVRPEERPAPARDTRQLYLEALSAQQRGALKEARQLYEAILSQKGDHVQALNNLGVICMLEGRHKEALSLFGKAVIVKRDYVDPYYNLACLYARSGEVKESLWYLKIAVSLKSEVLKWAEQDADLKEVVATAAFKKLREGH